MIRRPPRSTLDRSSAASDVYKRQASRDASRSSRTIARRASRMISISSLRSVLVDVGADLVEVTASEEVFINLLRDIPVERARHLRTGSGRRPDPHSACEFGGGTGWKQHSRPTRDLHTLSAACHRRSEGGA